MKRILTLVLCWLIAFTAMAETTFKVKTAASIAGGYVTSLNKVDGSFEDGTDGWVLNAGTIVKTASSGSFRMQGENHGVWSGTGPGRLDLQWFATASNTYEASIIVGSNAEDDMFICAYVGTAETGCKQLPILTKQTKISVIADSIAGSAFYLRLKHTGSDAFTIAVDDGKIEPWTPQAVNLVKQEHINYYGNSATSVTADVTDIPFTTQSESSLSELGSFTSSTTYTAKALQQVTVKAKAIYNAGAARRLTIYKNGLATNNVGSTVESARIESNITTTLRLLAGESITIREDIAGGTLANDVDHRLIITATAISDNVVQSWQDGTEWTSYTPTFSAGFGTVTNAAGKWKRSGSDLEVFVSCTTGTMAASLATVSLPSGLSIDSSKLTINNTTSNPGNLVGVYNGSDASSGGIGNVLVAPATSTNLFYFGSQDSNAASHLTPSNGNVIINSSKVFSFTAKVPIAGWSSAPTLYALPTRSEVFSANISASGVVTNATQNFVTSCTNAAPSVCTLWSNFGVAPICWTHTVDITKRAEVSSSTATTTTVARTDTSTAFNLFCHLK